MKQSLIIIESPFQLLCAIEAIKYFKLDNCVLFIRYSMEEINDEQIDKLLDKLSLKNTIKYIYIRSKNKKLFDYIKILFYSFYFILQKYKTDKIFIGNLESGFLTKIYKKFPNNKVIALDDGSKTIKIQDNFSENNFYNLFSIYKLRAMSKQNIYPNNFLYIKEQVSKIKRSEYILFLGSKLNEVNIISQEYYLDLIHDISDYFESKKIIYIPHRGENEQKIDQISKIKNIFIKKLDYPVELYGLYEDTIPGTVASFYSTALYTMQKMYDLKTIAFSFDYSLNENKKSMDNLYKYYQNTMNVISLEK